MTDECESEAVTRWRNSLKAAIDEVFRELLATWPDDMSPEQAAIAAVDAVCMHIGVALAMLDDDEMADYVAAFMVFKIMRCAHKARAISDAEDA